jgi:uncharacterized membrane protein YgcG
MIAVYTGLLLASPVFAQSSAPVTSSVFVHPATEDTGGESAAINDNWKFITNPPAHPVAASEPSSSGGSHRGKRGRGMSGSGGSGGSGSSSGGSGDTGTASTGASSGLPSNMPPSPPTGSTGGAQ